MKSYFALGNGFAIAWTLLGCGGLSALPDVSDSVTRLPVASTCGSLALACFDELSARTSELVLYRPATRWAATSLTWRLENTLSQFPDADQRALVRRAFDTWAGASALSFTEVADGADITISFRFGDHGDMFPFAGVDGTLGHAFFPSSGIPGVVHMNADKDWSIDGEAGGFDLFTAVLHEIGHSLGVEHLQAGNAVMSQVFVEPKMGLTLDDVDVIQRLYGDNDNKIIPATIVQQSLEAPTLVDANEPDTDRDGIPDSVEVLVLGTDPVEADTDGDGVNDFDEIFVACTDPLFVAASDARDSDGDGLSDDQESLFGTEPFAADTDGDGLDDSTEALFLGTDPVSVDTDGDGVSDGQDEFPTNPFFGRGPDPCDVAGLYGDGNCDLNCFDPDPDCDDSDCRNDCAFAFDGECDDGGVGAIFDVCSLGADCFDCGPRGELLEVSCFSADDCGEFQFCDALTFQCTSFIPCSNSCPSRFNGICEDGGIGAAGAKCVFGTDCFDCGRRAESDIPFTCESDEFCNDGNPCTFDFCDPVGRVCVNEPIECDVEP